MSTIKRARRKKELRVLDMDSVDLTIPDLEVLFEVTRMCLWFWINDYGLPHFEILNGESRLPRFRYSEVLEWAQRKQRPVLGRVALRRRLEERVERAAELQRMEGKRIVLCTEPAPAT